MTFVAVTGAWSRSDSSPVLVEWFLGWCGWFGNDAREVLRPYVERLAGSRGTTHQEVERQWLVVDWLIREAVPIWLRAAGLPAPAADLTAAPAVTSHRCLTQVGSAAITAEREAQNAHELAWSAVAELLRPGAGATGRHPQLQPIAGDTNSRRVETWAQLASGTRAAIPAEGKLIGPACRATSYVPDGQEPAPAAWKAATRALAEAAAAVAWGGAHGLVTVRDWWSDSDGDVEQRARLAASASLEPVESVFVDSAHALAEELFAITESRP